MRWAWNARIRPSTSPPDTPDDFPIRPTPQGSERVLLSPLRFYTIARHISIFYICYPLFLIDGSLDCKFSQTQIYNPARSTVRREQAPTVSYSGPVCHRSAFALLPPFFVTVSHCLSIVQVARAEPSPAVE